MTEQPRLHHLLDRSRMADEAQQPTPAPAEETKPKGLRCTFCKGSGADPDDPGDYNTAVHMYDPHTVGPCPECHGTGRATP